MQRARGTAEEGGCSPQVSPHPRGLPEDSLPPTMSLPAAPSPSLVSHLTAAEVAAMVAGPASTPSAVIMLLVARLWDIQPVMCAGTEASWYRR